jgi:hypothetical protein
MGRSSLLRAQEELRDALAAGLPRVVLSPRSAFGAATSTITLARDGTYRRSDHYGQWYDIPTRVSLSPGPKREHDWSPPLLDGVESVPYDATTLSEIALFRDILKEFRALS